MSVLIPVHNGEGYLQKSIRSVLAQGFRDFEVVVLDDGSSDGSARVARAFGDPRVRVYRREQHEGVAATRNHLLLVARHPLIAFLDADDVALPERLARQVAFLDRHRDVALVACSYLSIDAQGQTIQHRTLPSGHEALCARLLHGVAVPASTVLIRRHAIDAAGGFDAALGLGCEYDLMLKVSERARVDAVPEPLVKVRVHSRALSYAHRHAARDASHEARRLAVLRRHLRPLVFAEKTAEAAGGETESLPLPLPIGEVESPVASVEVTAEAPPPSLAAEAGPAAVAAGTATVAEVAADAAPAPVAPAASAGDVAAAPVAEAAPAGPMTAPDERGPVQLALAAVDAGGQDAPATAVAPAAASGAEPAEASAPEGSLALAEVAEVAADAADAADADAAGAAPTPAVAELALSGDAMAELPADAALVVEVPSGEVAATATAAADASSAGPRLAVVLVASGRQALPAVRSVLDQTLADLLLVVVATAHDDGLERGIELLADPRVLLLEAIDVSAARALNLGILASRSRYVAYLTETSVYRPEHLERMVGFLDGQRLGFGYADVGLATAGMPGSAVIGKDYDAELLLRENYIPTEAVVHRRDLLHEVGLFNEGLAEGAEWELWAHLTRVGAAGRLREVTVERVLAGAKALKLIGPSPARVRRYLSQKFSPRGGKPDIAHPLEVVRQEPGHDGDKVSWAQERLRQGDWAGAVEGLVEAATRPLSILSRFLVPPYPEREAPAVEVPLGALREPAANLASRPRANGAEAVAGDRGGESASRHMLSAAAGPLPAAAAPAEAEAAPPALSVEPEAEDDVARGGGRRGHWIMTSAGMISTNRAPRPAVSSLRAPLSRGNGRAAAARPLYSGPSFGKRRKTYANINQNPPCPLCGQAEPAVACRVGWIRVLDCASCQVAFSFPRLEPAQASRFFTDRRPEFAPPYITRVEDMEGTPFDRSRELSWVRKHVKSGKLVDVGCSWGYSLVQARTLGFEAFGTELSRTLARTARERFGLEVFERDLVDLGLDDHSMDVVLATHVIQHLLDPRGFLAEALRVLRADGVLVGSVPNFDAYLREALGRRFRWLDPESQPYHFRPGPLRRELEEAGFQVEMWTSEGQMGDGEIREYLSAEQVTEAARDGRGSEIGFIARKRG